MTTSKRLRVVQEATDHLQLMLVTSVDNGFTRTHLERALIRLQDWRAGLPGAASYDGDRVSSTSGSAPPRGFDTPDPTQRERDLADELIRRIGRDADALLRLVERNQPHSPSEKLQREAERENDPLCHHCTRWVNDVEPVHRTSDCNGVLPHPLPLGRWCYDFARLNGRLPSQTECERHDRGQVIRLPA